MKKNVKLIVIAMLALFTFAAAAHAGTFASLDQTFKFELERNSLTNVNDAAGRWQHEGGEVYYRGVYVGDYAIHRRVTWGGTDNQNTAMLTMTIFFIKGDSKAPQNITLQGSHDFSSGEYVGSVSAASQEYLKLQGAYFIGNTASRTLVVVR
jgi:hypothetical protein